MFFVSRTVDSVRSCLSTGEQYLHLPNTCSSTRFATRADPKEERFNGSD